MAVAIQGRVPWQRNTGSRAHQDSPRFRADVMRCQGIDVTAAELREWDRQREAHRQERTRRQMEAWRREHP